MQESTNPNIVPDNVIPLEAARSLGARASEAGSPPSESIQQATAEAEGPHELMRAVGGAPSNSPDGTQTSSMGTPEPSSPVLLAGNESRGSRAFPLRPRPVPDDTIETRFRDSHQDEREKIGTEIHKNAIESVQDDQSSNPESAVPAMSAEQEDRVKRAAEGVLGKRLLAKIMNRPTKYRIR